MFMRASSLLSAASFPFLLANLDSAPALFIAASFDPFFIVLTLPSDAESTPFEPSLGGTGGFEEECRRWWPGVGVKRGDEAAIEGDDEREETVQDDGQLRATRRSEEDIILEPTPRCVWRPKRRRGVPEIGG